MDESGKEDIAPISGTTDDNEVNESSPKLNIPRIGLLSKRRQQRNNLLNRPSARRSR